MIHPAGDHFSTTRRGAAGGSYTGDQLANRRAKPYVERVQAFGGQACAIGFASETLAAYVSDVDLVTKEEQLGACDVIVIIDPRNDPQLVSAALRRHPKRQLLPARTTGWLLWQTEDHWSPCLDSDKGC
jgi:hypothetical protein